MHKFIIRLVITNITLRLKLCLKKLEYFNTEMKDIINKELQNYNQSFESLSKMYKKVKNSEDSDSGDEKNAMHTLLTQKEADDLIKNFKLNSNSEWAHFSKLGGSYGSLSYQFGNREKLYEVNQMPPEKAYKGTRYHKISSSQMPAHLMKYDHHRVYPTTGKRNFPENWSADIYRFILEFLMN